MSKNKKVVLGLSGGMDSATLCAYYLDKGYEVFPVSFNYGSKHNKYENYAARSLAVLWNLTIKEINLDFIGQLFKSNLLKTGEAIPEGYYTDQNMSQTVVPGRNVIFISIMMGYAWSIGADTIAIGAHAGDHCLAEGSLISTTSGLTPIECLKSGDEIYSYNVKNQCVEKDKVVLLIKKGIPEEILEFTLKSGEKILVTEGHKMYRLIHTNFDSNHGFTKEVCKTQAKDVKEKDTFLLFTVDEKSNSNSNLSLKEVFESAVDSWISNGYQVDEKDETISLKNPLNNSLLKPIKKSLSVESLIKLCAWYLTEGWTDKIQKGQSKFSSAISQSVALNPENTEEIQELLKESMFDLKIACQTISHTWVEKEERIKIKEIREMDYYISGTLSAIFQSFGSKSKEKHIPKWMWNILLTNPELRNSFLTTCLKGDGHRSKLGYRGDYYIYVSFSSELLKQLTYLFRISGFVVNQEKDHCISITRPAVKKYLSSLGGIGLNQIKSIKKIKNEKPVYDIQIEKNHNFFAGSVGGILVSNSIYEDCRAGFIAAMNAAVISGSGDRVSLEAPFLYLNKTDILSIGLKLSDPVPYAMTRTCYKDQELSCGRCGSDVERLMAFHDLKEIDPIEYEDRKYYLSMIK